MKKRPAHLPLVGGRDVGGDHRGLASHACIVMIVCDCVFNHKLYCLSRKEVFYEYLQPYCSENGNRNGERERNSFYKVKQGAYFALVVIFCIQYPQKVQKINLQEQVKTLATEIQRSRSRYGTVICFLHLKLGWQPTKAEETGPAHFFHIFTWSVLFICLDTVCLCQAKWQELKQSRT